MARTAFTQAAFEEELGMPVLIHALTAQPHRFTGWTGAGLFDGIKMEFTGRDRLDGLLRWCGRGRARAVRGLVTGEFRVAGTELVIGDIAIDTVVVQVAHVRFVGITGVGGNDGACLV